MTKIEFENETDLERLRDMRAKIDAIESDFVINHPDFVRIRSTIKLWETLISDMITIRNITPKRNAQIELTEAFNK